MGEADAVRKHEIVADRAGLAGFRIVAQEAAVRPAFEQIEPPVVDVVALGRIGEIDRAVRRRCRGRRPSGSSCRPGC